MRRFRFTLLAVCGFLIFLGGSDLLLRWRNPEPAVIPLDRLEKEGPPREWLTVTGGHVDLLDAVNMSGTIEMDAFLVPLEEPGREEPYRVFFETRDPRIVEALKTYYLRLDSSAAQEDFLEQNRELFFGPRRVTGMLPSRLVAPGNRSKLLKVARADGIPVADEALFISEGKEPGLWRGVFFLAAGLVGAGRVLVTWRRGGPGPGSGAPEA